MADIEKQEAPLPLSNEDLKEAQETISNQRNVIRYLMIGVLLLAAALVGPPIYPEKNSPTAETDNAAFAPNAGQDSAAEASQGDEDSNSVMQGGEVYESLHGSEEHLSKYHPEAALADTLLPYYKEDPELFEVAVNEVYQSQQEKHYASFPDKTREPGFVASIPTIPAEEQEAFKEEYISRASFCPEDSHTPDGVSDIAQDVQFPRWEWAVDNLDIFVNQLRLSNFTDEKIDQLFQGYPLWVQDMDLFEQFRDSLSEVTLCLEEDAGWTNIDVIFTGSSANGFSMNPCKGNITVPTAISSPTKSDVDISFRANGVLDFVEAHEEEFSYYYPTTVNEWTTGTRMPLKDSIFPALGECFEAWATKWSELFPAGLQLTMYEDDFEIPPWEIRALYGR
ncbi:MAG: hypothetical protein SGARI_002476 [Bacillariaceae sp.]